MKKENNHKEIVDLIQQGRIKEALEAFGTKSLSSERKKALSIIEAEYNELVQDELKGVIDFQEKQIRKNRILDKLLSLTEKERGTEKGKALFARSRNLKFIVPLVLAGIILGVWGIWRIAGTNYSCPEFKEPSLNKILLIPFENVGDQPAKPQVLLRDRIHELTRKNNLSTSIEMGAYVEGLAIDEAPELAERCNANVIIWGKYSSSLDSIRLILQYHFLDVPDWSNMGELVVLQDVTSIQHGKMLKNLEDCIMSLCSMIAIRQGSREVAAKWLGKVGEKEPVDYEMLGALEAERPH